MDFDYIVFNFFAYKHNNLTDMWVDLTICGVSKGYNRSGGTTENTIFNGASWKDVTITKEELVVYAQNNSRYSSNNMGSDLGNLYKIHDKNGTGRFIASTAAAETFYIDSVTFGKNA